MKKIFLFLAIILIFFYFTANFLIFKFLLPEFLKNFNKNIKGEIKIGKISGNIFGFFTLENIEVRCEKKPIFGFKNVEIKINLIKFLKEKEFTTSIEKVNIYKPFLYLERDENGIWNINKFFIKKITLGKISPFKGKIEIYEGILFLKDFSQKNTPISFSLKDINSEINGINFPILFLKLDSGKKEIRGSIDLENFYYLFKIKSLGEDVSVWGNYFFPEIKFKNGKFDISIFISKRKDIYFQGSSDLRNCHLKIKKLPYEIKNLQGKILFNSDIVNFQKLKFNLKKSYFEGSGIIFNFYENPQIDFNLKSKKFFLEEIGKISPFISQIGLRGNCSGEIKLKGDLENPEIISKLFLKSGEFNKQKISNIKGNFKYYGKIFKLENFSGKIENGIFSLNGLVNLDNKKFIFETSLKDFPLENLKFSQNKFPKISGKTQANLLITSLSPLRVKGVFKIDRPIFSNFSLDEIVGAVEYKDNKIEIKKTISKRKNGKIIAEGELKKNFLDMKIDCLNLDLNEILKENFIKGGFDFSGDLKGDLQSLKLVGDLFSENAKFEFDLKKNKFEREGKIKGEICFKNNQLFLKNIKFLSDTSENQIKGNINFQEENFDIELISKNLEFQKENLNLNLNSYLTLKGNFKSPRIEGKMDSENILFKNQKIDKMEASILFEKNCLNLKDLSLKLKDSILNVSGKTELDTGKIDFIVFSPQLDLSFLKLEKEISGNATINGKIKGRWKDPVVEFEINSKEIKYGEEKFKNLNLSIYGDKSLFASQTLIEEDNQRYYLFLLTKPDGEKKYSLKGRGKISEGDFKKFYFLRDYLKEIETRINTDFSFEGEIKLDEKNLDLKKSKIELQMAFEDSQISNFLIEKGNIEGKWENGNLEFSELKIFNPETILEGKGILSWEENSNFTLEISSLNLEKLKKGLKGNTSLNILVSGKMDAPTITSFFEIENLSFKDSSFNRARGIFEYGKEDLNIRELVFIEGEHQLKISGFLPFDLKEFKIPQDKEISLSIDSEKIGLNLLKIYLKEFLKEIKGEGICHLKIKGTISSPEIYGEIITREASISFNSLKSPVSKFSTFLNFKGKDLVLKSEGFIEGGNFNIEGNLKFKNITASISELLSYNFTISSKNLFLDYSPVFKGEIEGNISLKKINLPQLEADIILKNSNYSLNKEMKNYNLTSFPLPKETSLNIKLNLSEDFWIKNENLNMETKGKLNILGTLEHPKILGEITSKRGTIVYLSSLFKLKEAVIFFEKIDSLEPTLFAVAETTVEINRNGKTYRIPVEIFIDSSIFSVGENIQFKYDDSEYYSETGELLTRSQIIAALSGFSDLEELLKEGNIQEFAKRQTEKFLLTRLKITMFEPIEQKIEKILKLKEFRFEYTPEKEPQITVEKYLFKNFSIGYNKTFTLRENQNLKFEYEFLKNQYLNFQIIEREDFKEYRTGLGVKLKI
jgi:hypothetical protein